MQSEYVRILAHSQNTCRLCLLLSAYPAVARMKSQLGLVTVHRLPAREVRVRHLHSQACSEASNGCTMALPTLKA